MQAVFRCDAEHDRQYSGQQGAEVPDEYGNNVIYNHSPGLEKKGSGKY
jgi:hypothetical protein